MENKISPVALFSELKGTLVSDIHPLEWPYVRLLSQQYRGSIATNLHWLQPFHEVFLPEFPVPKDGKEVRDFGSIAIFSMPWVLHQMGISLNELLSEVSKGLRSVIAREGAKIEARSSKMASDSAQLDLWLNKRLRAMAGSLVDLHFFKYKRHHPVSGEKAEAILEGLEQAGQRSLITGVFRHFREHAQEIGLEPLLPLLQRDWDFEKPLQTIKCFSAMLLPSLFDLGEVLIARLTDKRMRHLLEEKICNGLSESCQRLVDVMERYGDYRPRTQDYHLNVIRFEPRAALCFNIILEAKESSKTIRGMAAEAGMDEWEVYNFKRRLDYALRDRLTLHRTNKGLLG